MNGGVPRMTSRYGLRKIAQAVKMSQPNGGVAEPIAICSVASVPTSTGSMPADLTSGMKIGVTISVTTIGSTNMQPMKKAIEIAIRIVYGPASARPSAAINCCGTCANEMIHENAAPVPTSTKTMPVMSPVE